MHMTGTATDFLATFAPSTSEHHRDALVIAIAATESELGSWAWYEGAETLVHRELRQHPPRLLVIVLDTPGAEAPALAVTAELVAGANVYSTNRLGRDITAIGVTITDPIQRTVTAQRIHEHLLRNSHAGHGITIPARLFHGASLRTLLLEESL